MNTVCRDIFKAIHEGKWLEIEYRNKNDNITRYWIGIKNLDIRNKTLNVEAMHLGTFSVDNFPFIFIDSIITSKVYKCYYKSEPLLI